ncbi:unnamed protein product [Phaedon cochleariae]|uniref:SAM domain-containing protein n=1 Tax=Phaedon cochleariae TaxID=80249 RepID=A0A9P0GVT6_PHACE|nr:unnamed protein product [Phaedon cochleariae]
MGKGASKSKKQYNHHNFSWSRFSTLRSSKPRLPKENGAFNKKHKDISIWLQDLELEEYQEKFEKFQGVEDLLEFSEQDIKELGVKKSSHRARIISSLTCLHAKYHDNGIRNPKIRHSVTVDTRTRIKQEDTL